MDLILCHQTADFDALGAAVGLTKLYQGAKIVLTGGCHPFVRHFLALHRDELNLIERRSVNEKLIRRLFIVDTQNCDRLGKAQEWLYLDNVESITVFDHHTESKADLQTTFNYIEKVGSCSTIICEFLQRENITLNQVEATAMALGIHVDTGSLTFEHSTSRDASALAWLMDFGVNLLTISEYVEPSLSPQLQKVLPVALKNLHVENVNGNKIASVLLTIPHYLAGLSNLTGRIRDLIETDVLFLGHFYGYKENPSFEEEVNPPNPPSKGGNLETIQKKEVNLSPLERGDADRQRGKDLGGSKTGKLTIIGRSRLESINLAEIFTKMGGGGHSSAVSVNLRCDNPQAIIDDLVTQVKNLIPPPLTARDLMSSPVRTILPETTINEAQRILLRYGHSGLLVMNREKELEGVISRRDIDLALHHGFSHAPVKGYMTKRVEIINPDTSLDEIETLMVNNDIGRLPVIENDNLIGIVTRTDVLRQIHQTRLNSQSNAFDKNQPSISCLLPSFQQYLHPPIWKLLQQIARYAEKQGWHLYLVGGGVRDLLLTGENETLTLQDIDLVVDGFHQTATTEAGVKLAKAIELIYPEVRLSIHGKFQTAALLWHKHPELGSLCLDIATARTEFYPYPAANPQVEASSIRQDLYRRDFTINALAVRLTNPHGGKLLDFFGGLQDLRSQLVRVLHSNSFIEDPTRIYRAVRFAVKLNFQIEKETREYIKYAVESGVYERVSLENNPIPALTTRLKAELTYILQAQYCQTALKMLNEVGALRCLHSHCELTPQLWWQIRCLDRWLKYYQLYNKNQQVAEWLIRLEIILASFPEGLKVAQNLALPKDSMQRLEHLPENESKLIQQLSTVNKVSEKVKIFSQHQSITLLLIAVRNNKLTRKNIWRYLMHWSKIKPVINGNDLKNLDYKQNAKYKEILNQIQSLFLDGKIKNKEEAIEFLLSQ